MQKEITIVGAGLVGSLCALFMSKRGHKVNIFEKKKTCVLKSLLLENPSI